MFPNLSYTVHRTVVQTTTHIAQRDNARGECNLSSSCEKGLNGVKFIQEEYVAM